ncbi:MULTISPECIES: hypothetical protein [Pseudomonas]|uniref:hypothetical protein n=1 Tax=Pseudomonas TaxID=286 RepID=UPI002595C784|nr:MULTISPECIES: hypothetical protein [Pseudomonas]
MKIKALWGFEGDAEKLKTESSRIRAGQELEVTKEYGHLLIGKGLAVEVEEAAPKATKQATPKENK